MTAPPIVLNDGFPTRLTFSLASFVSFRAKTVKPPGLDAGGPVDTTTMDNTLYRTMQPKKLITLSPSTLNAAYDPEVYDSILTMLGKLQQITVHFPPTGTQTVGALYTFWGWIDKFEPADIPEGSQPVASVTIQPSNENTSGIETAPVLTPGS